jgi:hypothetical protein
MESFKTHSLTRARNETTSSRSTFHFLAGDMELASIPITPDPFSSFKSTKANKSKHPVGCSHPRLNKFVRRLHDMLVREKHSGIVEWRRGLLVLFSTDAFSKRILPKYFNTRNFKTFRRQVRCDTTRCDARQQVASAIHPTDPDVARNPDRVHSHISFVFLSFSLCFVDTSIFQSPAELLRFCSRAILQCHRQHHHGIVDQPKPGRRRCQRRCFCRPQAPSGRTQRGHKNRRGKTPPEGTGHPHGGGRHRIEF